MQAYTDYGTEYTQKNFMTTNEINFYKFLRSYFEKRYGERYIVFVNVRVLDLFQKPLRVKTFKGSLDFLICDSYNGMKPILAIELNGPTHNSKGQEMKDWSKEKLMKEHTDIPYIVFKNKDEKLGEDRFRSQLRWKLGIEF